MPLQWELRPAGGAYNIDIDPEDIEVSDNATIVWGIQ